MLVCTYRCPTPLGPQSRLGILMEGIQGILDPNLVWQAHYEREGRFDPLQRALSKLPPSLSMTLSRTDAPLELLKETLALHQILLKKGIQKTRSGALLVQSIDHPLACPLDSIPSYRDFFIHEKHVATGFAKRGEKIPEAWYEIPVYYKGSTKAFIGHEEEILWPSYTQNLDYELELAMVVGKDGRNIPESKAHEHIFGFSILNDVSARDIQKKEMSVRLGPSKAKDFCSVLGPVIATLDEFKGPDPDLTMIARVNGQEWSRGRSGDGHYSWAEMIAFASQEEWLVPGDVFGSGTVGTGCGLELDRWIKPGDVLELEIEKIGILRNRVGSHGKL